MPSRPSSPWPLLATLVVASPACGRSTPPIPVPEPVAVSPTPTASPAPTASASPSAVVEVPERPEPASEAPPPPTAVASASAAPVPSGKPYTLAAPRCRVTVGAVLEAQRYRGPGPLTPFTADTLQKNPAYARAYEGMSHGDQHIQCSYRVTVNGVAYAYMHVVGNTGGKYDVDRCEAIRPEVARDIRDTTRGCADLRAGEYYGRVLRPL